MNGKKESTIRKSWCLLLGIVLITTTIVFIPTASAITLNTETISFRESNRKADSPIIADLSATSEEKEVPILSRGDPWTVTLYFSETNGKTDYVVIAEYSLASEGIDSYDVPKPGLPPQPYLYAWLNNSLPVPYNYLWKDYRHYSGIDKVWNLNITCNSTAPYFFLTTDITISWSLAEISNTRFTDVELWYDGSKVVDMTTVNSYTFTANMNEVPFQYRYHFQIKGHVNQAPTANDDTATTDEDTPIWINVLANDADPDGTLDPSTVTVTSGPTHGTTSINTTTGYIQYTPETNYYGSDSFTYTVNDDDGAPSNTATVTIAILEKHQISLKTGWNLISVPCYDSITKAELTVYYNGASHSWSQAVADGYLMNYIYNYNRATQTYGFSDSLEPGYGYWIWAYNICDLLMYSNEEGTGHITNLQDGWNIMGLPYRTPIVKTATYIQNASGTYTWNNAVTNHIILGFVYGWDSLNQMYDLCDTFEPTRGYWMYSYQDCTMLK